MTKLGVAVVGASPDKQSAQKKFAGNQQLPFPLLADADRAVCKRYGVLRDKSMFGRKYVGVERSTFLIGRDGVVFKVFAPVKISGHVAEVISHCLAYTGAV